MKKPNYTIKSLSLALLITSCSLTSFMGLNATPKRIAQAVTVFNKHVGSDEPSMHWDDFVTIMVGLLEPTTFKNGANSLKRLAGQTNPVTVGAFLTASVAKNMPPEIQRLIAGMKNQDLTKLSARFYKSLKKPRLSKTELADYINVE